MGDEETLINPGLKFSVAMTDLPAFAYVLLFICICMVHLTASTVNFLSMLHTSRCIYKNLNFTVYTSFSEPGFRDKQSGFPHEIVE